MNPGIRLVMSGVLGFVLAVQPSCTGHRDESNREAGKDWPVYLGGNSSNQYSPLQGISRNNIQRLKVAWEYHTGDNVSGNRTQIQCNPLIIGGKLYATSPRLKAFALDAVTGNLIWEFDPEADVNFAMNVNRGVAFWEDGNDRRILYTAGATLYALNAETGRPAGSFGDSGRVSLREGLGKEAADLYVVATTPGIVYKDLLIIGSRVSENADAAPGFIRAYNVRTGDLAWTFRTIPRPGEAGYETWPQDAYKTIGGANCWSGMSLDQHRGVVYIPTGSAAFDFWGGNRKGKDLFANCILALNAETGERIWHYQTVYHDVWDRDLPAPPNLVRVRHDGKEVDAVAQISKSGFIFLLERQTGKPLFPVEERKVPASDLRGEETWPVQPCPVLPEPFTRQQFTQEDITDISSEAHDAVEARFREIRAGRMFIPPSMQGTLIFPGFDGGGEWGGAAFDPESHTLYVNANVMPWILTMVPVNNNKHPAGSPGEAAYRMNCIMCHGPEMKGDPAQTYPSLVGLKNRMDSAAVLHMINTGKGFMPSYKHLSDREKEDLVAFLFDPGHSKGTVTKQDPSRFADRESEMVENGRERSRVPYTHTGYNRFFDPDGYPAIKPPWGTLTAVNLDDGHIRWQVPLGEFPELTAKGIPKTGTENYGGPVVTAGGLLFIGASKDGFFRAFDKVTGEELWKTKLPAGGYATPSVYEAGGKQYIVIACGGGKMGTPSGDSYVAFTVNED